MPHIAPDGCSKAVVFDTNAYRTLARGKTFEETERLIAQLREAEEKHSVFVLSIPTVMMELIAHLADPKDPAYDDCLGGLIALCRHSLDKNTGRMRLIPDHESTIFDALWGQRPPSQQHMLDVLSSLVHYIEANRSNIHDSECGQQIALFANIIARMEREFVSNMKLALKLVDPNATDWRVFSCDREKRREFLRYLDSEEALKGFSVGMVTKYALALNIAPTPNEMRDLCDKFRTIFEVPLRLFDELWKRLAMSGLDFEHPKKSRANSLWDFHICFCLGSLLRMGSTALCLVTGDQMISETAKSANCGHLVMELGEYFADLQFCQKP